MILNIFATLFVLGITFIHSIFGFFSGIINVFCCIVALAVAFGFAEPVNDLLTGTAHLHPGYTEPFTLVLLFVITLLVLRLLADNLIRGNVRVPMYVDWGGGAVCGFVIAQICVGVAVLGFLMLPLGGRVMTFSRYERDENNQVDPDTDRVVFEENHLLLRSDEFAAGLFSLLSNGSLRGGTTFAGVYPDYPEWVFWSGNQVQSEALTAPVRDKTRDGFKDGLRVAFWWEHKVDENPFSRAFTQYREKLPTRESPQPEYQNMNYEVGPGNRLLGVRLTLRDGSADRRKDSAHHRFRPSMIRLVGDVVFSEDAREPRHYIAQVIGGADSKLDPLSDLRIADLDNNFSCEAEKDIDVYFEVHEAFEPRFIEYRRHARAALTEADWQEFPPPDRLSAEAPAEPRGRGRR
ncbi:MAG: CvpA family protein, partial [Phycisphaerae bacterium]|nr:CvpA family protein [Phycisphaerae bacterium]